MKNFYMIPLFAAISSIAFEAYAGPTSCNPPDIWKKSNNLSEANDDGEVLVTLKKQSDPKESTELLERTLTFESGSLYGAGGIAETSFIDSTDSVKAAVSGVLRGKNFMTPEDFRWYSPSFTEPTNSG